MLKKSTLVLLSAVCFGTSQGLIAASAPAANTNPSANANTAATSAAASSAAESASASSASPQSIAEKNLNMSQAFLEENKKQPGIKTLASGLQYKIIREGAGTSPEPTDFVTVHYRGTLINGTEFDSSYARNEPATFAVNAVIPGWTEILQLMKPGAKWTVYIPPQLAYGARGAGSKIAPNSALIFDIELLAVKPSLSASSSANGAEPEDND